MLRTLEVPGLCAADAHFTIRIATRRSRTRGELFAAHSVSFSGPCGPWEFRATTALRSVVEEEFDFVEQSGESARALFPSFGHMGSMP
jgi:hypothetical protein